MPDLFGDTRPAPTRIGQANGEFLGHLAALTPSQRRNVSPADYPFASPALVAANVAFWGGAPK